MIQGSTTIHSTGRGPGIPWLVGVLLLVVLRVVGPIWVPLDEHAGWPVVMWVSEIWLLGGILFWALSSFPFGTMARNIGRLRVMAVALMGALLLLGQFWPWTTDTYPFIKWNMYTASASSLAYHEVQMVADDTDIGRLPLNGPLTISKEPRAVLARLGELAVQADSGEASAAQTLESTVVALVDRLDRTDIDRVEIRTCTVEAGATAHRPSTCVPTYVVSIAGPTP